MSYLYHISPKICQLFHYMIIMLVNPGEAELNFENKRSGIELLYFDGILKVGT